MGKEMLVATIILVVAFLVVVATYVVRAFVRFHGKSLVTCPETNKIVAVEVDAAHAAMTIGRGIPDVRLTSCTRWPERHDCEQECVAQIELSPEDFLARNILANWYRGKACAFCHMKFGEIHWTDHKPALLNAEHQTIEWTDFPPETIPQVLTTHLPVCWNCHIAESFRREHPDLVTDRPAKKTAQVGRM